MFKNYQIILEIVKEESFSKAAESLFVSQPSLSAIVKRLEDKIGYKIFDRSSVPIRLTEVGEQYIKASEKIREAELDFENYLSDQSEMKKGSLVIGAPYLYSVHILRPMVQNFIEKYPYVQVSIYSGNSFDLVNDLEDSKIDLLFDNKQLSDQKYERLHYSTEYLVLAVPKNFVINNSLGSYALTKAQILSGDHLKPEVKSVPILKFLNTPFILMSKGNDTRTRSDIIFKRFKFSPKVVMELDQLVNLYSYAIGGVGAAIVNDTVIGKIPDEDNLIFYKIDAFETTREVCFYRKNNKYLKKSVATFWNEATDYIKGLESAEL